MAKILIIEDDTDINNMIAEYLSERNMEVEQAFSGTEGKLLWQMNPFDLLILDLMLPGMSGEELTAWIRKKQSGSDYRFNSKGCPGKQNRIAWRRSR